MEAGLAEESFHLERLRAMLLALGALLQRLDQMLPAPPPATAPPVPPDHDWGLRLLSVLLVVISLAGLIYYVFLHGSERSGGRWATTKMLMKPPRGAGPPTLYEHEGVIAAIALLVLILVSLGGLYYYYCFQAGCSGTRGGSAAAMVEAPGRKLQMTMKRR